MDHLAMKAGRDRKALAWAALSAGLVLGWQSLTVHYNYSGNWTALFCTGDKLATPPALAHENIYRFANSNGYDGQFYHYIAHDPGFTGGLSNYIDAPQLRYRRILLPGLAWLVAAGRARHVDAAYLAVTLAFIFLGTYWLSRYAVLEKARSAWGLSFILLPAVLVSMDRLTVDVALAALTAGFALYGRTGPPWKLYLVLVLAPLARETGLLLIAGFCLYALWQRQWLRAAAFSTAALPGFAWFVFVHGHTPPEFPGWLTWPLGGFAARLVRPMHYPQAAPVFRLAAVLDYTALFGMLLACVLALQAPIRRRLNPEAATAVLFALTAVFIQFAVWDHAYAFGRVFSPLLLFLALGAFSARSWWTVAPLAMVVPRIGLQLGRQVLGILRGLLAM